MSERIDDILDLIDAGLQTSPEHGYGCDHADLCARCQHHDPVEDGDLCQGCRSFLLGDTDDDPSVAEFRPRVMFSPDMQVWQEAVVRSWAFGEAHVIVQPSEPHDSEIRGAHLTFVVTDELRDATWAADNDYREWVDIEGVWWRSIDGGPPERCRNA